MARENKPSSRPQARSRPQDTLQPYRAKRNFSQTPEPSGAEVKRVKKAASAGQLSFVVQKHWASSLHYDFRLELDGTMKSWAVPKGPSLDPKDKRLAVQVEDHPIAYSSFEGRIPAGQYGAGDVIIWDQGFWQPLGNPRAGYREGNLKFSLQGHKLQGHWALVRMKKDQGKQPPWLLIKEKDGFARPAKDYNVVDAEPDSVAGSAATAAAMPASAPSSPGARARTGRKPQAALPQTLAPQLATLVDRAPVDPGPWIYEIKYDGYRILTRVEGDAVQLFTRSGKDWSAKLGALRDALLKHQLPAGWYDGEIVVQDPKTGNPDFGALQASFDSGRTGDIVLYLFDLPFFDGQDLRHVPLVERRALLQQCLQSSASRSPRSLKLEKPAEADKDKTLAQVRFSEAFDADADSLLASACKLGLEGLIGKRRDAPYVSHRSMDWIKLKCQQRQEFVVGAYTDPQGGRSGFGALLLGVFDDKGVLQYAGKVGTGFNERTLKELKARLEKLGADTSPFATTAAVEGRPHWVRPVLVAEVAFQEWTHGGHVRHAVFHGLRMDKEVGSVAREKPVAQSRSAAMGRAARQEAMPHGTPPALPAHARVTHPERVMDAQSGVTKLELVQYYLQVTALILPHLKDRPTAMLRAPSGIAGELFFQKHLGTGTLTGLRATDPARTPDAAAAMIEVQRGEGLLSAAQWNVVEFHTLNAAGRSLALPDRMVFDLDPGTGVAWAQVQEAAQLLKAFLAQLGLAVFLKTSGGKGLHVVVPLRRQHGWDVVKDFSHAIVQHLADTIPQRFVAKSGPSNRVGKIFIDYLRNGLGATTACAWSARARPGMGISVPVGWDELDTLRGADHWTVRTVAQRLAVGNAPWDAYATSARSLTTAMKTLGYQPALASGRQGKKKDKEL